MIISEIDPIVKLLGAKKKDKKLSLLVFFTESHKKLALNRQIRSG